MVKLQKLDRIDVKILVELQNNGRIGNVTLADAVGLSQSPCLARVKRLERAGYVKGYGAEIDLAKLGGAQTVFTSVTLGDHRREDFLKFERSLRDVEELMECHLVSGGFDYLLKFVTRGVPHYQEIIESLLERNVGIAKYFSYIVIKSPLARRAAPIKALIARDA